MRFGISEREQRCSRSRAAGRRTRVSLSLLRPIACERTHTVRTFPTITREGGKPLIEIGPVTTNAALDEDGRDLCGARCLAYLGSSDDHTREPRRQRQSAQPVPRIRHFAVGIERSDRHEFFARGSQGT
jgi:hypothetical protein